MKRTCPFGLVTMMALIALALPAAASADVTKEDRSGDATARGLKAKDRRALDIVQVDAATNTFGLLVTATMRGNTENRVGSGKLRRGAIALVLRPEDRDAAPRILAVGDDDATASNLPAANAEAAVVEGREVTFVIDGVDASQYRRIEIVTLSTTKRRRARGAGTVPLALPPVRRAIDRNQMLDTLALVVTAALIQDRTYLEDLTCDELDERALILEGLVLLFSAIQQENPSRAVQRVLDKLADELRYIDEEFEERPCFIPLSLTGQLGYVAAFPGEIRAEMAFAEAERPARGGFRAASTSPIDAVRLIVPRQVTNFLCSQPLPNPEISTTNSPNDTLTCSGGSLPLGQQYSMNVQTNPPPSDGMGATVFARQDGKFVGPLALGGP
jgi:hypothetical protein